MRAKILTAITEQRPPIDAAGAMALTGADLLAGAIRAELEQRPTR